MAIRMCHCFYLKNCWRSVNSLPLVLVSLIFFLLSISSTPSHAYPPPMPLQQQQQQLPPAFGYQPTEQQLAMAVAGMDPSIRPVNFQSGYYAPMLPTNHHHNHQQQQQQQSMLMGGMGNGAGPMMMPFGASRMFGYGVDGASGEQQHQHVQQQPAELFIRNSPFQQPPPIIRAAADNGGTSSFYGQQQHPALFYLQQQLLQQQPAFPHGMATYGKSSPFGSAILPQHPSSAALLPSDIPVDVLVGRQGGGLNDDVGGGRHNQMEEQQKHPFPLSSANLLGTDPFQEQQKPAEERIPSPPPAPSSLLPSQQQQQTSDGTNKAGNAVLAAAAAAAVGHNSPPSEPVKPAAESLNGIVPTSANHPSGDGNLGSADATTASDSAAAQRALPVFLRGSAQEFVDEFKRIIRQPNGTYAEQVRRIDAMVARMDPERQLLYREFMRENDDRERVHRDRVHKSVAEMSDKAQEQFAKISATLRNPNMPDQERWDRVLQLYGKMEPELRNEFEQKFKGFPTIEPPSSASAAAQ